MLREGESYRKERNTYFKVAVGLLRIYTILGQNKLIYYKVSTHKYLKCTPIFRVNV